MCDSSGQARQSGGYTSQMPGQTAPTAPPESRTLLERMVGHLLRPVSASDLERAAWHVLDWLGCAAAGQASPTGAALIAAHEAADDAQALAFTWGGFGNVLEMDDVDRQGLLHPGPVIVPAILATAMAALAGEGSGHARTQGPTGAAVLAALVRGYEATIRLGRAVGPGHYALWHNTGTCGAIGAAMAAASLAGLDRTRTAHALALAVSQTAGLWHTRHDPASMGKQLHTAHAAQAGVRSMRLARNGFKGPLAILEGPQGFFAAMCPGAHPGQVLTNADAPWAIHEVSFKPWAACRHAHAAIDAALVVRARLGRAIPERIRVEGYRDALTFCDKPNPATEIEAKFSLQHAVAVVLARGKPTLDDFLPGAIADPTLAALRTRTEVAVDAGLQAAFPRHFGARVTAWAGGHPVTGEVADALGDPENPLSCSALEAKARSLMQAGGWADEVAARAIAAVWGLPGAASCAELLAVLGAQLVPTVRTPGAEAGAREVQA